MEAISKLSVWEKLQRFILPRECIFCHYPGEFICQRCLGIFFESYGEIENPAFSKVFIAYRYNKALKHYLGEAKHEGYYKLAVYLGELLFDYWWQSAEFKGLLARGPTFIPVPLAEAKLNLRGFNQVSKIISGMNNRYHLVTGKHLGIDVNLLKRSRETVTQVGKNREQRRKNLQGVFTAASLDKSKTYVLVDDIYTTGTTLNECAKVLSEAGATKLYGLIFARS